MNVLSLFDGMSCGQIALNKAKIKYKNYYASEIDKHAICITQKNYPNTIQLGDVTRINLLSLPKIDLLIGGSPCTGFSSCGKGLNFDDPQSKLFFDYVKILNYLKPKYFLLENVQMKDEYKRIITSYLKVPPIKINSSLVSAQNRIRLYWTNISVNTLPKDRNLTLKDIIEDYYIDDYNVTEKYKSYKPGTASYEKSIVCLRSLSQKGKTLTAGGQYVVNSGATNIQIDDNYIRKITPIEAERLQTVPDNYTQGVSDNQRYRMLGNGWTVDVIAHIFQGLNPDNRLIHNSLDSYFI